MVTDPEDLRRQLVRSLEKEETGSKLQSAHTRLVDVVRSGNQKQIDKNEEEFCMVAYSFVLTRLDSPRIRRRKGGRLRIPPPHELTGTAFIVAKGIAQRIVEGVRSEKTLAFHTVCANLLERFADGIAGDQPLDIDSEGAIGPVPTVRTEEGEEMEHEFPDPQAGQPIDAIWVDFMQRTKYTRLFLEDEEWLDFQTYHLKTFKRVNGRVLHLFCKIIREEIRKGSAGAERDFRDRLKKRYRKKCYSKPQGGMTDEEYEEAVSNAFYQLVHRLKKMIEQYLSSKDD